MTATRTILTFAALCVCILATVRCLLEAVSAFILGTYAVGVCAAMVTGLLGYWVWWLRRELTRETESE